MPDQSPDPNRYRLVSELLKRNATGPEIDSALEEYDKKILSLPKTPVGAMLPMSTTPTRPLTLQETIEGNKFYGETLPRMAVQAGAGLSLAPFTGGMSIPAAFATEAAGSYTADQLYQQIRQKLQPSYQNQGARESANIALWNAGPTAVVRGTLGGLRGLLANKAGIPAKAVADVAEAAPYGGPTAGKMVKVPPENAQFKLGQMLERTLPKQRASALPAAQEAVIDYPAPVDTKPVYDYILSKARVPPEGGQLLAGERTANRALGDLAGSLPEKMSMDELHQFLQRIRGPIEDQLGKEGGSLATQDLKDVQAFIRIYRDKLLTDAGGKDAVKAFAVSSKQIDAIDEMKALVLDDKGNLLRSAPNTLRRVLGNPVILRVLERYQKATGEKTADVAKNLAMRQLWNSSDYGDLGALTEILAGVKEAVQGRGLIRIPKGPARSGAKFLSVYLTPQTAGKAVGTVTGALAARNAELGRVRSKDETQPGNNP